MAEELQTEKKDRSITVLLVIIVLLLAAVLATNIFTITTTNDQIKLAEERDAAYAEQVLEYELRASLAKVTLDEQLELIDELVTGYHESAYNDPRIERIAEQQLIAAEHQLIALQLVGLQNNTLISLLSEIPFMPGELAEEPAEGPTEEP